MRKIIDILSILGLFAAPIAIGSVYTQTYAPQSATAKVASTLEKFPLNQPQVVEFQADTDGLKRLSNRQQLDQRRDWLLLTVLSSQGLSAKEINQSVYDLPTVRYDYMQPVANFEYGETRSLYVGHGKVIALVPKGTTKEQRMDDLAHIADRHRKDVGKQPTSIAIFEYDIQPDNQSAILIQYKTLDAKKIFSSEYGYREMSVQSLDDLQKFMGQIDDVTFSQIKDSNLILGGRKIHARQYQGIRVEDIATIWQSEQKIQTQESDFKLRWNQKISVLPTFKREAAIKQALEERRQLRLVDSSGFSLDPAYDYAQLKQVFAQVKPLLKDLAAGNTLAITQQDILNAEQGLTKNQEINYLILLDKLAKSSDPRSQFFSEIISRVGENSKFQAARYDGDLKGTEVGMVLFYTDLLAKLWAINYLSSAPSKNISDFTPLTKVQVSSIYKKEIENLTNTRLWFGSQDRGFQLADEGNSLLFARNATRIYSASSNPLDPGKETSAAANSDAFLSWWNDHYEEVSHHEPQYERLNQIMKWSLVINWLNQSSHNHLLGFLQPVSVRRNNWFPHWAQLQGERLRFKQWQQIQFFDPGDKGRKTESMPLLNSEGYNLFGKSWQLSGGVSLASKSTFEGRQALSLTGKLGESGLRSTLKYDSIILNEGKLAFSTLDETKYAFQNLNKTLSSVTAQVKEGTKFRSPDAEIANKVISRNVSRTESGLQIDTAIGNTDFGTFNTSQTRNGFVTGFLARDMDHGYSLFAKVSSDHRVISDPKQIVNVLKENSNVQAVLISSAEQPDYLVKIADSKQWIKARLDSQVGGGGSIPPTPPNDWQMMVGDLGDNPRNFRLIWIDEKIVQEQLASGEFRSVYSAAKEVPLKDTHGFFDNWFARKYKKTAQKILDNTTDFFEFKRKYFEIGLKNVDHWIKAKNYSKAALHLDRLLELYGPTPNLILRRAVLRLEKGTLNVKRVVPKDMVGKNNFQEEINFLIEQNQANFSRTETKSAFIYVQDHPGLNNHDWNVPIDQTIPLGSGARIYQLLPGKIGEVKLTLKGLGDTSTSFHSSTQSNDFANSLRNLNGSSPNLLSNSSEETNKNCNDSKENKKNDPNKTCPIDSQMQEKPVYVVIMSDKT